MSAHPTAGWKLLNSWWVLISLLGLGCLSGLGFLAIGLRARRPAWWLSGLAYLAAAWTLWIVFDRFPDHSSMKGTIGLAFFAVWLASIVHSLVVNPAWLRWLAARLPQAGPQQLAPPPSFPAPAASASQGAFPAPAGPFPSAAPAAPSVPAGPFASAVPFVPAEPFAPSVPSVPFLPAAFSAPAAPAPAVEFPASPAAAAASTPVFGPVDVNSATAEQLAGFGEFDLARAEGIVAERETRNGFGTLQEFATVAALAPHQFARLRYQLACNPRRPAPPAAPGPAAGRVLDV